MKLKKLAAAVVALMIGCTSMASACTALYVGSDLTSDGTTLFGRSEDLGSKDYNKVFYVSPAGNHTEGEEYSGCYGFTYTFTHDSYSYTARRDDNLTTECPDCGGTHDHTPYEEAGTNEKGVMVSATESLYGTDEVLAVDPYVDEGIEEAEITTVLLSEAATAKEGVELLTGIYDTVGAAGGSGVFIADQNETWFVENLTGHTWMAVKLSSGLVFMQPNVSAFGKIDLDDTDNVLASENVISVAVEAGTFVGDEEANVIDFSASYNGISQSSRMAAGLNYLNGVDTFTEESYTEEDFAITNVDADGNIVANYTNITLTDKFDTDDVFGFWKVSPIGSTGNLEIHVFQVDADGEDLATSLVEWTEMDSGLYNVFVPYYAMLTTDTADCYKVSIQGTTAEEDPGEGDYYYNERRENYVIYPENWKTSYYWSFNALNNLLDTGDFSDEDKAAAAETMAALQTEIYADYAAMQEAVAAADTLEAKQAAATDAEKAMAEKVQAKAVEMYDEYKAK